MAVLFQTSTFRITAIYISTIVFGAMKSNIATAWASKETAVVTTAAGSMRGAIRIAAEGRQVYSFTGIPYAEPPLGELRYRKPQPATPWGHQVLNATKTPPSCMQISVFFPRNLLWIPYDRPKSEDCLYLNIWTPKLESSAHLPVMAWLHGGELQSGSAAMWLDDGGNLAALGQVVVVTIAYRWLANYKNSIIIGVKHFLHLSYDGVPMTHKCIAQGGTHKLVYLIVQENHRTVLQSYGLLYDGTESAPGNQAFHDQVLALKWIQDNIKVFGGDPDSVTLFGWSSGGLSTGFHLLSPGSQNLFKRAIIQSSGVTNRDRAQSPSTMLVYTKQLAEVLGCYNASSEANLSSESMSCLRSLNSTLITSLEQTFIDQENGMFEPIYGDEFLPVRNSEASFPGDKDVMIGHVANEGSVLLYDAFRDTFSLVLPARNINKAEMIHYIGSLYSKLPLSDVLKLQSKYMDNISDFDYDRLREAFVQMKSDTHVVRSAFITASKLYNATASGNTGNGVYVYEMDYVSRCNKRRPWFGMTHGDDTPLAFGRPFDPDYGCLPDIPFSRKVVNVWTNFARGGKPAGPSGSEWPKFQPDTRKVLKITARKTEVYSFDHEAPCAFLRDLQLI